MPSSYKQNTEGELIALFKLPADVISAYFAAVGEVFSSFEDKSNAQISALDTEFNLERAQQKHKLCLAALESDEDNKAELLKAAGCST